MRHKLTNLASIPDVIADMTLDEKLNLVGAYKACHTLEIPDMNISALNLTDGATGVNGVQVILDYITAPENKNDPELRRGFFQYMSEFSNLVKSDLTAARDKYKDRPFFLGLIDHIEKMRPDNTDFISFPSGINIGASFDPEAAYKIGQAVGCEMRHSGIDAVSYTHLDVYKRQNQSLIDIAFASGFNNYKTYSTAFKKHTGMTFTEYLTKYRLQKARMQLMASDSGILEIALNNGFSDDRRLILAFRQEYGTTPFQYRKMERNKEK